VLEIGEARAELRLAGDGWGWPVQRRPLTAVHHRRSSPASLSVWWVQAVRHARGREPTQAARHYGPRWRTQAGPVTGFSFHFWFFFIYFTDFLATL
jgi:hypothetical protein